MKKIVCIILCLVFVLCAAAPAFALTCPVGCGVTMKTRCYNLWAKDGSYYLCPNLTNCRYRYVYYYTNHLCGECGKTQVSGNHQQWKEHISGGCGTAKSTICSWPKLTN